MNYSTLSNKRQCLLLINSRKKHRDSLIPSVTFIKYPVFTNFFGHVPSENYAHTYSKMLSSVLTAVLSSTWMDIVEIYIK